MQVVEVAPDALVIRFSPVGPDNVLKRAALAARRRGYFTSSVFAAVKTGHEDDEALRARLLRASELHHIDPNRNEKYFVCARAGDLLDLGFVFMKDEDEDEAAEHYSVHLGDSPSREDVERFLSAFTIKERRAR